MEQTQTEPLALASLIIGLFGWVIACCGGMIFPLIGLAAAPLGLIGVVLGGLSMQKISREPEVWSGQPIALVGILLNVLMLVMMLVMAGLMVAGVGLVMLDGGL
jgi:hypothetical protein